MQRRSTKSFLLIILYGVLSVMSFVLLFISKQTAYIILGLTFLILTAFKVRMYYKYLQIEEKYDDFNREIEKEWGETDSHSKINHRFSFKEKHSEKEKRKQRYEDYINQVEEELGDFDENDYLDENEAEEDGEEDNY